MLNDMRKVLNETINFFTKNYNIKFNNIDMKINNIIESTSFDKLSQYEKRHGFKEAKKSVFFRKGKAMQWKDKLKNFQVKKIESAFEATMKELDYL